MIEHYRAIKGAATLILGFNKDNMMKKSVRLDADQDDHIRIPFGMPHQMIASKERGILTLITTSNPHNLQPGQLHKRDNNSAS